MSDAIELEVGARTVRLSSPDRVYFPDHGWTKLDVAQYYMSVGDGIVRALRERPCMLHRFPKGLPGGKVHQKRLPAGAPEWVETVQLYFPRYGLTADELCVTELAQVIWAVQMSTVEFHPWNSRRGATENPDEWRIDLDPMPRWLAIDAPLTFSAMPYPPLSKDLAFKLHQAGYRIMMHVPTQNAPPNSFSGKGQLAVNMDSTTVFKTLDDDLASVPFAKGLNNHQGGLGCDDLTLMTRMCQWAKQKGMYVVDSSSSARDKVSLACTALGMPHRKNEVFIDHQNDPNYIRNAMRQLAELAKKNGTAIGICHWHRPNTPTVVGEMIKQLKNEGIHFAFVQDVTN